MDGSPVSIESDACMHGLWLPVVNENRMQQQHSACGSTNQLVMMMPTSYDTLNSSQLLKMWFFLYSDWLLFIKSRPSVYLNLGSWHHTTIYGFANCMGCSCIINSKHSTHVQHFLPVWQIREKNEGVYIIQNIIKASTVTMVPILNNGGCIITVTVI